MQLTKKIKAFTLSEMLVVLLLTSIVGGIAFSVLNLVQKQLFLIQGNYKHKTVVRQLEQSLTIDFNTHQNIKYDLLASKLTCYSEIDSINYIFAPNYIVKGRDTFRVSIQKKQLFFTGGLIEEGRIDAIKIDSIIEQPNRKLFIFKYNDASTYMN